MITSTRLRDDEEHPDRTKYTVGIEVVLYSSASALVMTPMVLYLERGTGRKTRLRISAISRAETWAASPRPLDLSCICE